MVAVRSPPMTPVENELWSGEEGEVSSQRGRAPRNLSPKAPRRHMHETWQGV
jgi:hypothetical protein